MKKIILVAFLGLSLVVFSACGSSNDNEADTNPTAPVTDTNGNDANPTAPVTGTNDGVATSGFTSEILVGNTYSTTESASTGGETFIITFTETAVNVSSEEEGDKVLPYTIDANGILFVVNPEETYSYALLSIEGNGDLNIINDEGQPEVWILL